MRIGIIGGGAIGLLFAYYLNRYHDVCLYVRTDEQAMKLRAEGLIFECENVRVTEKIRVSLFEDWNGSEELNIITVKQYHLQDIFKKMTISNSLQALLFLQNGMGHLEKLEVLSADHIFVGTVEHGASRRDAHHVIHTGKGMTKLARFKGNDIAILHELASQSIDGFPFQLVSDYQEMLQQKLMVNAVINPLTAVLKVRNGELLSNPYYFAVFKRLFTEVSELLEMPDNKISFIHLQDVCRKTGANRSSMLCDLEANRLTEVDAIVGYLLKKAEEKGVAVPLTGSLYQMIKGMEFKEEGN